MKTSKQFYLSHLCVTGTSAIFTHEIDMKRFLDIVRIECKQSECKIYAFCLLEGEIYFLLMGQSQGSVKKFVDQVMGQYFGEKEKKRLKSEIGLNSSIRCEKRLDTQKLLEQCRNIHHIPLEQGYVKQLKDYWWSSYHDYTGRHEPGIVDTESVFQYLDKQKKKALKKFVDYHKNFVRYNSNERKEEM